jgi:low temperature requirement protein LtrA
MNAEIYNFLKHLHSIGRWIVLVLLVIAIFNSLVAGKRPWIRSDARTGTFLVIFADLMLLVGLAQWYWGKGYNYIRDSGMSAVMKGEPLQRFFAIEHLVGMLIAIIFIHIGKAQARKAISDKAKHRRTVIFYLIALIIILAMIPWPFREVGKQAGSGWY